MHPMPAVGLSAWQVRPVRWAFFFLAVATLAGLNGASNMMFDTGWHVTLSLAFCSAYLCAVVRVPFGQCLGSPGLLILGALAAYLWIGGAVVALTDGASLQGNIVVLRVVLAAVLIVGTALGAAAALRCMGADRLLLFILYIQAAACIAMLMTPFLVDHVYSLSSRLWHVEESATYRLLGTFVNPNAAGIAACQGVVTALALVGSGKHMKVASLVLILAFAATVLTYSRIAILALAGVCVFFLFSVGVVRVSKFVLAAGVCLIGAITAAFLTFFSLTDPRQLERLTSLIGSSDVRMAWLWPNTLSQIAESPLFGHGITLDHAIAVTNRCSASTVCGPHNSYLMLWREAGIAPSTLFLLFVLAMLYGGFKIRHSTARGVVVGWAIVLGLQGLTGDGVLYSTSNAFIIGLSCALIAAPDGANPHCSRARYGDAAACDSTRHGTGA